MTQKITLGLFAGILLFSISAHSQSVGIGTETPNSNAILELVAPNNDQGLLVPRMTTAERTAATFISNLSSADNGLMVFDEDLNTFFFWMNDQWVQLSTGNQTGLPDQSGQNGRYLTTDGTNAQWSAIDFSSLANTPAGLSDGDDVDDADADATNELQDLSLATNTLSLSSSAATVDLSSYLDNTDAQDLDFTSGILTLSGDPDATVVDLSNYDSDVTDDFDGAFSSLSGIPTGLSDGDNVDDADNDATNEFQDLDLSGNTLSLTNSSVTVDLTPFAGTNTDNQTLSLAGTDLSISGGNTIDISSINVDQDISTDGTAGDITISGGSNLTLNVDDADADATNELQDLSLATNTLSLSGSVPTVDLSPYLDNTDAQDLDFTAGVISLSGDPDATNIDLSNYDTDVTDDFDGVFSSLSGIPAGLSDGDDVNDADADATNELQDLSLATNTLSLSGSAATVSLAPYLDNTDAQDLDFTSGVITLSGDPDATNIDLSNYDTDVTDDFDGVFSSLSGIPTGLSDGDDVNDADADPTNEIELPDQTSNSGNFLTTNGSSPSWSAINESQWTTNGTSINYTTGNVNIGSGTIPSSRLQLSTSNTSSTTPQLLILESDASSDAAISMRRSGTNITMGIDADDASFRISGATTLGTLDRLIMDSQGTVGIGVTPNAQFHVQTNSIESSTVRLTNTNSGAGSKIGLFNELNDQGTSIKTGIWNDIDGTTGETGNVKSIYNVMNPTDGTTYGLHTQINSAGSGVRYGTYNDVRSPSGNASNIYGFRAQMDNDGDGDSFGFQANMLGSTSTGRKYGIYNSGEDYNYFSGNVGIGEVEPDVELYVERFTLSSTLPMIRLSAPHDAAISYEFSGGVNFISGIDATNNFFKIAAGSTLGTNDRFVIDLSGNVGIGQSVPSAKLDVVGDSELNGEVSGDDFVYTTGNEKSHILSLSGAEFRAGEPSLAFASEFNSLYEVGFTSTLYSEIMLRGGSSVSNNGTVGSMVAPIHLPNGAVITQIDIYGRNSSSTDDITATLITGSTSTGSSTTALGTISTSTSTVGLQISATSLNITVDNSSRNYLLLINSEIGARGITGVQIYYTKSTLD